jgi:hypothetical protein
MLSRKTQKELAKFLTACDPDIAKNLANACLAEGEYELCIALDRIHDEVVRLKGCVSFSARELRSQAVKEAVADYESEFGKITDEEMAEARVRWWGSEDESEES